MPIFSDDFETGEIPSAPWTGEVDTGNYLARGTPPHSNTYSAKLSAAPSGTNNAYVHVTFTQQTPVYVRAYARFENLPGANGEWLQFLHLGLAGTWFPRTAQIFNDNGTVKWRFRNFGSGGTALGTTTVAPNTWYCVELESKATSPIYMKIWNDSGALIETLNIAQAGYNNPDSIRAGPTSTGDGYGVNGYIATAEIDDVVVDVASIGPLVPPPAGDGAASGFQGMARDLTLTLRKPFSQRFPK